MNKNIHVVFNLIKCRKYQVEELFTPSSSASVNYIARNDIDRQLYSEMTTPGKQIIVFGHSGSGKTSSVRNMLRRHNYKFIKTHCESKTTFEQLILNAFDELDSFVVSEKSHQKSRIIRGELAAEYVSIKSCIGKETEDRVTYSRIVPPQLTPQKLARFMGEANIVWLIEDFHKVSENEKRRIADIIKIFVDNANDYPLSKIICIGACESAHELLQLDPNLSTRVSEISVPLLHDEEIKQIIENGFKLLNITLCDNLVKNLVYYADRLGASAHQMCLDICSKEDIKKTSCRKRKLEDKSFQAAIDSFINRRSDTLKTIYEVVTKDSLGWYILKTFSNKDSGGLSTEDIVKTINKNKKKLEFSKDDVISKLEELMSPQFNIIYYNRNTEKYALSTPFWHRFLRVQLNIEASRHKNIKKNKMIETIKQTDSDLIQQIVDNQILRYMEDLTKINIGKYYYRD